MQTLVAKIDVFALAALLAIQVASGQQPPANAADSTTPSTTQAPATAPGGATLQAPDYPASSTSSAINGFYDKKGRDDPAAQKADVVSEHVKDKLTAADALQLRPLGDDEVKAHFEKFFGMSPSPREAIERLRRHDSVGISK